MRATLERWPLGDTRETIEVECKRSPLYWQALGLQQTASGYGRKLTTEYKVKIGKRWRRVYACCISNNGTMYIGNPNTWEYTVNWIDE